MFKSLILFLLASTAFGEIAPRAVRYNYMRDTRSIRRSMSDMDQAELAGRADTAIEEMVNQAARQLVKAGQKDEANRITLEFEDKFQGYLSRVIQDRINGLGDIGDHRPLSQFLTDLYDRLLALLGPEIMHLTHLEDIKTFNYTIPVVFHLTGVTNQEIDAAEYEKHWDPFWGVTSYWVVWGVCTGVTWGGGWFLVCSPAGVVAKEIVVNYIAPKFSDNGYNYFYGPSIRDKAHPMEDRLGCIGVNVIDLCKL